MTEGPLPDNDQTPTAPLSAGVMSPITAGAMFAALKDNCECRACKILRVMADQVADVLLKAFDGTEAKT